MAVTTRVQLPVLTLVFFGGGVVGWVGWKMRAHATRPRSPSFPAAIWSEDCHSNSDPDTSPYLWDTDSDPEDDPGLEKLIARVASG